MRTSRSNGSTTYHYVYNGSQLTQMRIVNSAGTQTVDITYDAAGTPLTLTHCDTDGDVATYYYVTNIQGDVIGMTDTSGNLLIAFHYDAYGTAVYTTYDSTLAPILAQVNPLGYRGYVMDSGTGLYYLQSRYYDTAWGRFINADALVTTGQGLLGNNMFAYCGNNPVRYSDPSGTNNHDIVQPWFCTCSQCQVDNHYTITTGTGSNVNTNTVNGNSNITTSVIGNNNTSNNVIGDNNAINSNNQNIDVYIDIDVNINIGSTERSSRDPFVDSSISDSEGQINWDKIGAGISIIGGVVVVLASALSLLTPEPTITKAIGVLGILEGVCMIAGGINALAK